MQFAVLFQAFDGDDLAAISLTVTISPPSA